MNKYGTDKGIDEYMNSCKNAIEINRKEINS
jgi:hypothetical protein